MKQFGKMNGEVICFFSHGTNHSRGVCILLHPTTTFQMEYSFHNNTGRIVLITILYYSQNVQTFKKALKTHLSIEHLIKYEFIVNIMQFYSWNIN